MATESNRIQQLYLKPSFAPVFTGHLGGGSAASGQPLKSGLGLKATEGRPFETPRNEFTIYNLRFTRVFAYSVTDGIRTMQLIWLQMSANDTLS